MRPTPRATLFPRLACLLCLLMGLSSIASADTAATSLQQKSTDLLGGESRAVCYSGFRSGQHPDRGAGAINPSDAEILEDLNR